MDSQETVGYVCPLNEREIEITRRLARGQVAKTIAADMGLSHTTVHHDIHAACRLVGVSNRTELVAVMLRKGWIE